MPKNLLGYVVVGHIGSGGRGNAQKLAELRGGWAYRIAKSQNAQKSKLKNGLWAYVLTNQENAQRFQEPLGKIVKCQLPLPNQQFLKLKNGQAPKLLNLYAQEFRH